MFPALGAHFIRPDAGLGLSDVSLVQQYHAQAALPDTTTYAQRQSALKQAAMEIQFLAVALALKLELAEKGLLIHSHTHG